MVRVLDLYCGMGGFSLGLSLALEGVEAHGIDIDLDAVETYNRNLSWLGCHADRGDLLTYSHGGEWDIVVGGPPCQPFSTANTVSCGEKHRLFPTFHKFFDIVKAVRPKAFIFENVKGLVTRRYAHLLYTQLNYLAEMYHVKTAVLNAADYGVPQKRLRLIVVGVRRDLGVSPQFPRKTHARQPLLQLDGGVYNKWVTVREAIGDLVAFPPSEGKVSDTMCLLTGGRIVHVPLTAYQKKHPPLSPDMPGNTIYSHVAKASRDALIPLDLPSTTVLSDGLIRPHGHHETMSGVYRRLTVRECLRLQSFPDWWSFPESVPTSKQYKLVGEAVPPILAYRIAVTLGRTIGLPVRVPPSHEYWRLPYFYRAFADHVGGKGE